MQATRHPHIVAGPIPHLFSLWSLFKSPEVHELGAQNMLIAAKGRLLPVDLEMATDIIKATFVKLSEELAKHAPQVADELKQIEFTTSERTGLLEAMRLLGNPLVQKLGLDVARAIRASPYADWFYLQHYIETALEPRTEELVRLRRELMPEPLRKLWAQGHQWGTTLNPENIRSLRNHSEGFDTRTVHLTPELDDERKYFSMYNGALQEGRSLLDLLQMCIRALGPEWIARLNGTMVFAEDALSWPCDLSLDEGSNTDFMKALLCPLKFGAQGIDALTAARIHDLGGPVH
jgi:hypothetical protein